MGRTADEASAGGADADMAGLSGVVGPAAADAEVATVPPTVDDEVTDTHRGRDVVVRAAFHEGSTVDQPVETAEGALVWVWGEVFSVTGAPEGRRQVDPAETARVCAEQFDEYGRRFVERLDGEFLICLYDPDDRTVALLSDRCGARPLYYAVDGDSLAFSTNVQTVPAVSDGGPAFAEEYLAEYLYSRWVGGTKTPVVGIEQIPPATVLTFAAADGSVDARRYWEPRYRPVDRPISYFTRELADRIEQAVADRTPDPDGEYGLLLSGGSDSRAIVAAGGPALDSYHLGDGWNREARAARRAAEAVGSRFELLERGPDYHETLLERAAPIQEFVGPFNSGHMLGHAEGLSETDALLTGLYCDVLFGSWGIPQLELPLPFGVRLWPPIARVPSTPAECVARQAAGEMARDPAFLRAPPYEEILAANVHGRGDRIEDHGIEYPSARTLGLSRFYYPITNGIGFDLFAALQVTPTRTPFLDRRLLDLHLSMPLKHRLRRDPIGGATKRLAPSAAAVPHASTSVPLGYPKAAHVVGNRVTNQLTKLGRSASYRTEGPLQDKNEVVRATDFVGRALKRNEERIRRLPCLDWEAVERTYRRHRAREADSAEELYRLLSVVETPLAGRVVDC